MVSFWVPGAGSWTWWSLGVASSLRYSVIVGHSPNPYRTRLMLWTLWAQGEFGLQIVVLLFKLEKLNNWDLDLDLQTSPPPGKGLSAAKGMSQHWGSPVQRAGSPPRGRGAHPAHGPALLLGSVILQVLYNLNNATILPQTVLPVPLTCPSAAVWALSPAPPGWSNFCAAGGNLSLTPCPSSCPLSTHGAQILFQGHTWAARTLLVWTCKHTLATAETQQLPGLSHLFSGASMVSDKNFPPTLLPSAIAHTGKLLTQHSWGNPHRCGHGTISGLQSSIPTWRTENQDWRCCLQLTVFQILV